MQNQNSKARIESSHAHVLHEEIDKLEEQLSAARKSFSNQFGHLERMLDQLRGVISSMAPSKTDLSKEEHSKRFGTQLEFAFMRDANEVPGRGE